MDSGRKARALAALGASPAEVGELLAYNENRFDLGALDALPAGFPLPDEPFVAAWEEYAADAGRRSAFAALAERLPQLRFPIRAGMSESAAYLAATRQGVPPGDLPEATGLVLARPGKLELILHPTPAGRIPVLIARERSDFVALVRALTRRNEPTPVPDSQGAVMIAGYNNWDRIRALRRAWEAANTGSRDSSKSQPTFAVRDLPPRVDPMPPPDLPHGGGTPALLLPQNVERRSLDPGSRETATWNEEFARIKELRELYQDRFILLSDGPYSAVPAADLGLAEATWREASLAIRREHECAHYFTRRLFGSMRNNLLDELIADYAGIRAATERFRADWFLRFLGLEGAEGGLRPGGRLTIYRGDPPLSDGAFAVLGRLVRAAAVKLERFDAAQPARDPGDLTARALALAALASLRLEEIAAEDGPARLERARASLRERLAPR